MTISGLLLFCGVYDLAVYSPGPAVAAVIARVIGTGIRRTAPFIWGIVLGDVVWFAMVVFGLAALAEHFHTLFLVIKYAGVAYLLYLAWKLWTARPDPSQAPPAVKGEGLKLFLGGLAITLGNPKVMAFFISILPLVVDLASINATDGILITGLIVVILSTAMWSYALMASRARRVITSPRAMRLVNRGTGTVMAGAAATIALRG